MNETLVYDAARDASNWFTIDNIAMACVVVGFALIAIPTILTVVRRPEKRTRGFISLGLIAAIAVAAVFGLRTLDSITGPRTTETIEGVVGSVTPKLVTVGGMKIMISCSDPTRCPGVAVGDRARVAYVDDSGPETDALATQIWKRSKP